MKINFKLGDFMSINSSKVYCKYDIGNVFLNIDEVLIVAKCIVNELTPKTNKLIPMY